MCIRPLLFAALLYSNDRRGSYNTVKTFTHACKYFNLFYAVFIYLLCASLSHIWLHSEPRVGHKKWAPIIICQ